MLPARHSTPDPTCAAALAFMEGPQLTILGGNALKMTTNVVGSHCGHFKCKSAGGKERHRYGMWCRIGYRTMFFIRFTTQAAMGVVPFFSNAGESAGTGPVDAKIVDSSLPLSASYFDILAMSGFGF